MTLGELKTKLAEMRERLPMAQDVFYERAQATVSAMKMRVFDKGLMPDGKPIGKYGVGNRRGRAVKLTDTGELKKAIKAVRTAKGVRVVAYGQGAKIGSITKRYGKVFRFSPEEIGILTRR